MNVEELIAQLEALPGDSQVWTWDDGTLELVPLTDLAEVRIGTYGHELTASDEGTPAVMLLAEQRLESILGEE